MAVYNRTAALVCFCTDLRGTGSASPASPPSGRPREMAACPQSTLKQRRVEETRSLYNLTWTLCAFALLQDVIRSLPLKTDYCAVGVLHAGERAYQPLLLYEPVLRCMLWQTHPAAPRAAFSKDISSVGWPHGAPCPRSRNMFLLEEDVRPLHSYALCMYALAGLTGPAVPKQFVRR
jgi:hypothetical protein